ncbi:MAG: ferritin-like domain-containing protein [Myxococcota bacterium]|nr:ferritin-like domain-containing protein [Myxococcota bacterium]
MTEGVLGCSNPSYPFGEESGLVACDGNFLHRAEAGKCPQTPLRPGEPSGAAAPGCEADADCAHLLNGRCLFEFGTVGSRCVSSCETDEDCGAGYLCSCGPVANQCVPSNCQTDADCGEGLLCTAYDELRGCMTFRGFACQVESDQCTSSCPPDQSCKVMRSGDQLTRACVAMGGAGGTCGRPFLVSGSERRARPALRDDWCERWVGVGSELTDPERAALAAYWEQAALMEHASIAAFARFTLELLALGAPARLVEQASAAMLDEQRHATTCFSLASAFAGQPLGPDSLPLEGCLTHVELAEVAVTTFLEGCVGETLAAIEARELARDAQEPALSRALGRIAEDEARHSLLAWSFLDWALKRGGPALAARVKEALRSTLARTTESVARVTGLTPEREAALGLPSPAFRAALRDRVLDEIVSPSLDALLAATSLAGEHDVRVSSGDAAAAVQ